MQSYLYLLATSGILTLLPQNLFNKKNDIIILTALYVVVSLFIGLRGETIGPDWYTYKQLYLEQINYTLFEAFTQPDPGYYGIAWVFRQITDEIIFFNFFVSIVTVTIYYRFCKKQAYPLLAFFVGLPFFIIYTMNFPRQAIAMAIASYSFQYLFNNQKRKFILGIFIAILFHKTAVLFLVFLINGVKKFNIKNIFLFLSLFSILFIVFLSKQVPGLISAFSNIYSSNAAHLKGLIYLLPALVYFSFRKKILKNIDDSEKNILDIFALMTLTFYFLLFINNFFYNVIDRLYVYFLPFEIMIFSNYLPRIIVRNQIKIYTSLLVIYKLIFFYIWLSYAYTAKHFIPYYFNL